MIGPLLWLIYLLISIPNAHCLAEDDGLMSWFGVNMGVSDED